MADDDLIAKLDQLHKLLGVGLQDQFDRVMARLAVEEAVKRIQDLASEVAELKGERAG